MLRASDAARHDQSAVLAARDFDNVRIALAEAMEKHLEPVRALSRPLDAKWVDTEDTERGADGAQR